MKAPQTPARPNANPPLPPQELQELTPAQIRKLKQLEKGNFRVILKKTPTPTPTP